jgi:hypothetical protein
LHLRQTQQSLNLGIYYQLPSFLPNHQFFVAHSFLFFF